MVTYCEWSQWAFLPSDPFTSIILNTEDWYKLWCLCITGLSSGCCHTQPAFLSFRVLWPPSLSPPHRALCLLCRSACSGFCPLSWQAVFQRLAGLGQGFTQWQCCQLEPVPCPSYLVFVWFAWEFFSRFGHWPFTGRQLTNVFSYLRFTFCWLIGWFVV